MKYLLILLLSAFALTDVFSTSSIENTENLYIDQTDNAISSREPMFYACKFGFQLRPVTCTGGYDGKYCKGWGRNKYSNEVISKLIDITFPEKSQSDAKILKGLPLLSNIAQDAYRGRVWDQDGYKNGRDNQWLSNNDGTTQCSEHGFGPGA